MVEFLALAAQCAPDVHPTTLAAVVRAESAANPLAIGINGGARLPRQPSSKAEAVATAEWLMANGYNFDAGLGQVNVKNFGWLGLSVSDLFEPCSNLKAAARVLRDCYDRASLQFQAGQPALQAALSCYNTGNFSRGFANGYVHKVAANAVLPVPALLPMGQGGKEPIRVQATKAPDGKAGAPTRPRRVGQPGSPADDETGLGDAFSQAQPDAFAAAKPPAESPSSK
jgi:type IV secretion system protein VirB1